jgi:hypothetical protein
MTPPQVRATPELTEVITAASTAAISRPLLA